MGKCGICGKGGEDVSLLFARHRDLGGVWLCSDCWRNEYSKIVPSGSSGSCCG
ncbi:MAG: hypothetical protein QMC85_01415 [Methanocellales archaeon]|nr:hypothetical protein [Methanocellales archaeon]